jgi:hypothetical protein
MSIIESLKRLFDPIEYRQQKQEQRRKAEAARPDESPDRPPPQPETKICRVCAYQGTDEFCPRCLAGTMERRRRRREDL